MGAYCEMRWSRNTMDAPLIEPLFKVLGVLRCALSQVEFSYPTIPFCLHCPIFIVPLPPLFLCPHSPLFSSPLSFILLSYYPFVSFPIILQSFVLLHCSFPLCIVLTIPFHCPSIVLLFLFHCPIVPFYCPIVIYCTLFY